MFTEFCNHERGYEHSHLANTARNDIINLKPRTLHSLEAGIAQHKLIQITLMLSLPEHIMFEVPGR